MQYCPKDEELLSLSLNTPAKRCGNCRFWKVLLMTNKAKGICINQNNKTTIYTENGITRKVTTNRHDACKHHKI